MTDETSDDALVQVYVGNNAAELPVIESLLDEAGIEFMTKGAEIQNLFGWGQVGGGNLVVGPVGIWVAPGDAEAALALIATSAPADPALET